MKRGRASQSKEGPKAKRLSKAIRTETKRTRGKNPEVASFNPTIPRSSIDPLMIDHVLEKIFFYLFWPTRTVHSDGSYVKTQVSEVKAVRLVCKLWNGISTRLFRRHCEPTYFMGKFDFRLNKETATPEGELRRFVNLMENSSSSDSIPMEKCKIATVIFTPPYLEKEPLLFPDFVRVCGPFLAELELSAVDLDVVTLTHTNFQLPSLKSFEFHAGGDLPHEPHKSNHVELMTLILKAAPDLNKLDLYYFNAPQKVTALTATVEEYGTSLLVAAFLNIPLSVKYLTVLDFVMTTETRVLDILSKRRLRLTEFTHQIKGSVPVESELHFLESQGTSLKVLDLTDYGFTGEIPTTFQIPPLPLLETLYVTEAALTMVPISYFPSLKKLVLTGYTNRIAEICGFLRPGSNSLRETRLYCSAGVELMKTLRIHSFPNLKRLHYFPPTDSTYYEFVVIAQTIFEHCNDLEVLHLGFCVSDDEEPRNMDSLLSGIPQDVCDRFKGRKLSTLLQLDVLPLQSSPALSNLTRLRRLRLLQLNLSPMCIPFVIVSTFSACVVFHQMPTLNEVGVGYKSVKITRAVRRVMAAKMNIVEDRRVS